MESKEERLKRKNRERVSRHRTKKRLGKELREQTEFFAPETQQELNLEAMMAELDLIKEACERKGIPLWASKRYQEWEKEMDRLIEEGKLPPEKHHHKKKGYYIQKGICQKCGYPENQCVCDKQKESTWLKTPKI